MFKATHDIAPNCLSGSIDNDFDIHNYDTR